MRKWRRRKWRKRLKHAPRDIDSPKTVTSQEANLQSSVTCQRGPKYWKVCNKTQSFFCDFSHQLGFVVICAFSFSMSKCLVSSVLKHIIVMPVLRVHPSIFSSVGLSFCMIMPVSDTFHYLCLLISCPYNINVFSVI